MTSRRAFLGTVATGIAAGSLPSPPLVVGDVRWNPAVQDPDYRLLKRLRGVDRLGFNRHRRPGGWDGQGGDRYLHELWCRGIYDGNGGDWEFMRCSMEISASRPDPVLRVVGSTAFESWQAPYVLVHHVQLHFHQALPLEVYVEAREAREVLVVATWQAGDPWAIQWTAPAPRWTDA